MDLNKKLKELKPQQLNCNVFDVYSYNGLTMQDLLCQFFTTINECVKSTNEVIDLTDWLVNIGLEEEVVKKLMGLIKDGTVEKLINVNLFENLNKQLEQKASLEDVAKISSGTPLFAISIAEMTDTTKNYVNTTDGYLYIYINNEWKKSSLKYQEAGLSDGQVTEVKTNFMIGRKDNKNLFNKDKVTYGNHLTSDGSYKVDVDWCVSDYISVLPNSPYNASTETSQGSLPCLCFYDINKTFIGAITHGGVSSKSYTTPSNCYYVRDSVYLPNINNYIFEKGTTRTTYEEYKYTIDDSSVKKIYDDSTILSVINRDDLEQGAYTGSNGERVDSEDFRIKKLLKVQPNSNYVTNAKGVTFYDEKANFISGVFVSNNLIITPLNAYYVGLNFSKYNKDNAYIYLSINNNKLSNFLISNLNKFDRLENETFSILGDSISTFKGYISRGNEHYYDGTNCGVSNVNQTWWKRLEEETGMSLLVNNSWSGSRVSNTSGNDLMDACMTRCVSLHNGDVTPDHIIVYIGVNDYLQNVPLGDFNGTGDFPTTGKNFKDAYALMINKIHQRYPLAKVYCCTLLNCERDGVVGNLESRGGQYLYQFNNAIKEIANLLNCKIIDLNSCGIHQFNINHYMGDYQSSNGWGLHPNKLGHYEIFKEIKKSI